MPTILKQKKRDYRASIKRVDRQKIYLSKAWKSIRKTYLMNHPLCELCLLEDIYTPTQHIHHIISPFNGDSSLAFNTLNLLALCEKHHSEIHSNHKESDYYYIYYDRLLKNNSLTINE